MSTHNIGFNWVIRGILKDKYRLIFSTSASLNDDNHYSLPGVGKPLDSYGSAGTASSSAKKDDDSDDDFFGDSSSEDELDDETKAKLAAYNAKKAKSKDSFES